MDDSELDRLFGKVSDSGEETPKEDGAGDTVPEKKKTADKNKEKNVPLEKPEKKKSEDKNEKKKDPEKKPEKKKAEDKPKEKKDNEGKTEKKPSDDDGEDKKESENREKPEEDTEPSVKDAEEAKDSDDADAADVSKGDKAAEDAGKTKEEKPAEPVKERENPPEKKEHENRKRPAAAKTPDKPERKQESVKNGLNNLRDMIPLSGKSLLAVGLALAVVIMVILIMFLPAFRVRNTNVEGNVVLSDQEILKAAGLEYDAHLMSGVSGNIFDILRLDYGKTEQRIKKENPYIEDIRITIKLPSTVDITVKERSKVCYIRTPDGYAALDKDGIVLELSSFDAGRSVRPVICGLNIKGAELGKPVKIDNIRDYKKAIIVLGAILAADNASVGGDYSMFENTSEVRILPSGYIFLTIYSPLGNLIQIKLDGTDSIGDDMAWLLYAFNSDAFDKLTVNGALDMTGDEYIFDEYD